MTATNIGATNNINANNIKATNNISANNMNLTDGISIPWPGVQILKSSGSPNAGDIVWGDGTGWRLNMGKTGNPTLQVYDNNNVNVNGHITVNGPITANNNINTSGTIYAGGIVSNIDAAIARDVHVGGGIMLTTPSGKKVVLRAVDTVDGRPVLYSSNGVDATQDIWLTPQ